MDIYGAVFLSIDHQLTKMILTFVQLSKTEVGSAGEQPIRDNLIADENVYQRVVNLTTL